MCSPVIAPVAMAALSVGTTMYAANQQRHALKGQMKEAQRQTDEQASAQTDDRYRAAREARAAARAASAESGASGHSVDAILQDILMQSGRDVSRIEKNRQNGQLELQAQARGRTAEINGSMIAGFDNAADAYMEWEKRGVRKKAAENAPRKPTVRKLTVD